MQQKNHTRADLEATSLGRFLLEEVPWRVRERRSRPRRAVRG